MFEQTTLRYASDALEPHIDTLTVETHYGKHHATYTKNFNDAVAKAGLEGKTVEEIFIHAHEIPEELRAAVLNNGGGFYNHNLYFDTLSPNSQKEPTGPLKEKIDSTFGGMGAFVEKLSQASISQFGSGWGWLSTDKNGNLSISSSSNQSNPILETKGEKKPLIALDVWEHAYYLKYKNLRADYVKVFFELLDWAVVEKMYEDR